MELNSAVQTTSLILLVGDGAKKIRLHGLRLPGLQAGQAPGSFHERHWIRVYPGNERQQIYFYSVPLASQRAILEALGSLQQ